MIIRFTKNIESKIRKDKKTTIMTTAINYSRKNYEQKLIREQCSQMKVPIPSKILKREKLEMETR